MHRNAAICERVSSWHEVVRHAITGARLKACGESSSIIGLAARAARLAGLSTPFFDFPVASVVAPEDGGASIIRGCVVVANRMILAALVLILICENLAIYLIGSSLLVSNIACVLAFVFFTASVLPTSFLGFALTYGDWGDVFRRELLGHAGTSTASEIRGAATKSLAIWSIFIAFGAMSLAVRSDVGEHSFMTGLAVLVGMESGFLAGFFVVSRRRNDR